MLSSFKASVSKIIALTCDPPTTEVAAVHVIVVVTMELLQHTYPGMKVRILNRDLKRMTTTNSEYYKETCATVHLTNRTAISVGAL